ncbi:CoA-binding protein [Legionella waltersii]|uniref:CoA-binding protein n=1 Tax=Legionella waltersii TaxID=66969 RepID=A0A0W1ACF5_9GAMM|nr:CoA-binding protein [Legionella waltersii]KTD78787.1 CoA-binding protein [Legionella waltersii]SNV11143.1 CoA-binding protein [Legionella waltersii]
MVFRNEQVDLFLKSKAFAVAGASTNRDKYGNKVLRCYLQHNLTVYPLNPKEKTIEGIGVVHTMSELPEEVNSLSIITPPAITEQVVSEAIKKGIKNVWMQPGAESEKAIQDCLDNHVNVIAKGPCILVALGYRETP